MNNPKEFLEAKMNELVSNFNKVLCRYEFHSQSDAHYIEITPSEQYNENAIREGMADILYAFYDLFPNESLVFLTDTDGIQLYSAEITIKGSEYTPSWECLIEGDLPLDFIEPLAGEYNYALAA